MKKTNTLMRILCVAMAMLMLFCVVSCDKKDDDKDQPTTPEKTVTVNAPAGYAVYKNADIGFAYPETWEKEEASTVIMTASNGNNITLAYEDKNDTYANMSLSEVKEMMDMIASMMGGTASNVTTQKVTNGNGVSIVKMGYTLALSGGITMDQTMFITNAGAKTYIVTVTEVVAADDIVTAVFNSIAVAA